MGQQHSSHHTKSHPDVRVVSKDGGPTSPPVPDMDMPSKENLEIGFQIVLDDLGITEDKREQFRNMTDEQKWTLLKNHFHKRDNYIPELINLRENPSLDLLSKLAIMLRSSPVSWVMGFLEAGGLNVLLDILGNIELEKRFGAEDGEEVIIKCIRALMNNKPGLAAVMDLTENFTIIGFALRSTNLKVRTMVLHIFSAVCLIPGGHPCILEALSQFAEGLGFRSRFEIILRCLMEEPSTEFPLPVVMELHEACFIFINAVTCGGPGANSLDVRVHTRYEFYTLGIDRLIQNFVVKEAAYLETQINVFEGRAAADEAELAAQFGLETINYESPESMFTVVCSKLKETRGWPSVLSTMRHLLLMPNDPALRAKYWTVLDRVVQQIVLQKDSANPDPYAALIDIDMATVVGALTEKEKLAEAEEKAKTYQEKLNAAEKALSEAKAAASAAPLPPPPGGGPVNSQEVLAIKEQLDALESLLRSKIGDPQEANQLIASVKKVCILPS
ncbi:hypothetical protein RI367_002211 [Sorochytrium milnesiophthora]